MSMKMDVKTSTNLTEILSAHERIKPYIRQTPLENSFELSRRLKAKVALKLENLQVTGSFKPRGSLNKLLKRRPNSGVIASTAGNHGIGVAYAAQRLGLNAEIYLPTWADEHKIAKLKQFGANLTFFETVEKAREAAKRKAREKNLTFISAYNDLDMIFGGGTVGIEIYREFSDVEVVVVGVGGGGLASGICLALKALNPKIQIIGVQAEKNSLMSQWIA
jgi:threonine dehydratase